MFMDFGVDLESRRPYLEKLISKLSQEGFEPLPLTAEDMQCYWVRIAGVDGKSVSITPELYEDALLFDDLMNAMKKVCKIS